MSEIVTETNAWADSFDRLVEERDDAPWLLEMRRDALGRFLARGLPSPRDEDWLYTNARKLDGKTFTRARAIPTPAAATFEGNVLDLTAGPRLAFVNGHFDAALSRTDSLPEGVTLAPLSQVLEEDGDALRNALEPTGATRDHPFAALNTAFVEDGVWLSVAPGTVVTEPIQVVFVMTSWQDDVVEHPRVIVRVGERAEVMLLERYEAQGPGVRFTNTVTQVDVGAGAVLRHVRLQREGATSIHVGVTEVRQHRDSTFQSIAVSLGGTLCRQEAHVDLVEEGASTSLSGLSVIGGQEHVDNHTVILHHVPHCTSHELFKNIVGGRARSAFTGLIVVEAGAQKTDSSQANHNLLLSPDAVADTRPQLVIHADDVKCAHGATIGQLDEEQAFYLRSRGLGPLAARNLLIHGFAREVLDQVQDSTLRARLEQVLASRLNVDAS